jgi:hypothetical protein
MRQEDVNMGAGGDAKRIERKVIMNQLHTT